MKITLDSGVRIPHTVRTSHRFKVLHAMPDHPHLDISKLLHCGCYALLKKGEVIYVGKSKKPMVRLYTHFSNRGKVLGQNMWGGYSGPTLNDRGVNFDGVWFWPCMLGQLGTIEMYLIRKYMPRYNQIGKPMPVMPIPDDIKELLRQMIVIDSVPQQQDPVSRSYMVRRL